MKEITMWRKDISRAVIQKFNPDLWNLTNDIIDRAFDIMSENADYSLSEAIGDAVGDALIYTDDEWHVYQQYVFAPVLAYKHTWGEIVYDYIHDIERIVSTFIGD